MAATMANLFAGNPLTTPVGHKIERATDSTLASEDWGLNMEICDMINQSEDIAKDASRAIRKRLHNLAGKNFTGVLYTLTVLETCVKNCGRNFHALIFHKEYIQDLIKLIGPAVSLDPPPKSGDGLLSSVNSSIANFADTIEQAVLGPRYEPPLAVQEKTLSLVQSWAHAFRGQPDLVGVSLVYDELIAKGVQFPETAETPIITPHRSQPVATAPAAAPALSSSPAAATDASDSPGMTSSASSRQLALTSQQSEKLEKELRVVDGNLQVLNEMLSALKPTSAAQDDLQLLKHLASTCHTMQERLVALVGRVSDDTLTAELLRLNDELNNAFIRYERFERSAAGGTTPEGGPGRGPPPPAAAAAAADATLIDLGDSTDGLSRHLADLAVGSSSAAAQLQRVPAAGEATSPPPLPARVPQSNMPRLDAAPDSILQQETDFAEMEQWLNSASGQQATASAAAAADSATLSSSEFDRFLAERAAASDSASQQPTKQQ